MFYAPFNILRNKRYKITPYYVVNDLQSITTFFRLSRVRFFVSINN